MIWYHGWRDGHLGHVSKALVTPYNRLVPCGVLLAEAVRASG
jgi:hypothetical protein